MFFRNEQQEKRATKPSEKAQVNETSVAELWLSDDKKRINWDLTRLNPKDPKKPFRTKRPEDLAYGDWIEGGAFMASALSQAPNLPKDLRDALSEVSKELQVVADRARERFSSVPKVNGETGPSLLFSPSHAQ